MAVSLALIRSGAEVAAWDDVGEARAKAASSGVSVCDLNDRSVLQGCESLILSPGIPHLYPAPNPIVDQAVSMGVPLDNDIGLFLRWLNQAESPPRVVAVTGSNGKSTASALIHFVLERTGGLAQIAGNIGQAVFGLNNPLKSRFMVLEISSYQAEIARCLAVDVAVFLNLSPDHLCRHGGVGGYFAAKSRLFNRVPRLASIIGVDEPEGRLLASKLPPENVVRISAEQRVDRFENAVFAVDGQLIERRRGRNSHLCDLNAVRSLSGAHNQQNACAAYAACRVLGVPSDDILSAFAAFSGLPHRSQVVGEFRGILCVNDSKATNAASAGRALEAYKSIRWILGGLAKEGGIAPLLERMGNVKSAYLIGHSAREFALQLGTVPHRLCGTMDKAVQSAVLEADPGDTILLAPAAASFDQYPDFEVRGEHFIDAVRRCFSAADD